MTDAHFALTPDDVEAVLRERGESVLRERGIYNIDILDHLLAINDTRADILVQKLSTFGDDERSFLQAYLAGGEQREQLIRKLAERWRQTFDFIISEANVDDPIRVQLLNTALERMTDEISYVVNKGMRTYFEEHYSELSALTSNGTSAEVASMITGLLTKIGARLASLSILGAEMKRAVIAASRYIITRDNLVTAIGESQGLALDRVREHDSTVYGYVLDNLTDYLAALRESEPTPSTVEAADAFEAIIEDVCEHAEGLLPEVIAAASPQCQVSRLADVPEAAWPTLAEHKRFPATFENIKAYIDTVGQVDAPLAQTLLAASDVLSDPKLRTSLVISVGLEARLPATSIQPEPGHLIGLLIDRGIIEDDAASFALALATDWQTWEFAISQSKQFSSFMTPTEVPVDDVGALMESTLVYDSVKDSLLNRVDQFVPNSHHKALTSIAKYADRRQIKLTIELVTRLATAKVEPLLLLRVLEPLLPSVTEAQLVEVLQRVGGEYAAVSERNGRRPKLPHTKPHIALIERLEKLGIVSSHQVSDNEITVNMKRGQSF